MISFLYDAFVLKNLTDKTILLFLFSMNIGMFALIADMIDKRLGSWLKYSKILPWRYSAQSVAALIPAYASIVRTENVGKIM